MRCVHAAGTEETNGHGDTIAYDGREVFGSDSDSVSTCTSDDAIGWVEEVKGVLETKGK